MRFEVLGPLRVVGDGAGDEVLAGRLRVLLAVLLWRVNQPVSADELSELVWDGDPPRGASAALRALVLRLRRALGPQAGARIVTRAPGYAIEVGDGELDATVFEALCLDTDAAVRMAAWGKVSATAEQALGLWRGTALADVSCQALRDAWVPRLDQQRVQVWEWFVEAELRLGRHEQVVAQVRELVGQHPLRERFHAQLMVALYRSGRQAEALAAYQQARRVLVDELGIEPGAELRQVHERILAGDADLLAGAGAAAGAAGRGPSEASAAPAPAPAPAAVPTVVPRQLPAAARHFIGRRSELEALLGLLGQAGRAAGAGGTVVISAIDGMAGVGKTALAVQAAHRLAEEFPDGQLFIDLHGFTQGYEPRAPGEALEWLLRAVGVAPEQIPRDVEERAALFRQQIADARMLIVLDNAVDEAQVRPLLPASAGCLVLVTSRRRLRGLDDAFAVPLDVLPEGDAVALLRTVAGPDRVRAADPLAREVAELCGRLPLAVRIAGALLRHRRSWPLEHLVELLRDQPQRLAVLADAERDLAAVFDLSYRNLSDAQRGLFRRLGLILGPDVDAYAAAALTGTAPAIATRLLQDLVDHNLLGEYAPGRYRLHDLMRAHARTLAATDAAPDRDATLDRLLDYYQYTAARADALLARHTRPEPAGPVPAYAPDLRDPETAHEWLRTERANLLSALQYAADTARGRRVIALTSGLANLLRIDGRWADAIELHTAAATTAERLGDRHCRADALMEREDLRRKVGETAAATQDLETALALYRDLGDRHGEARATVDLGFVRLLAGDRSSTTRDLESALEHFRDAGDRRGQANTLQVLGDARRMTGDTLGALGNLEAALDLYRDLGDRRGQAAAMSSLGDARRMTGNAPGAVQVLEAALALYRDLGDRRGQAAAMTGLGYVRRMTGDLPGSALYLEAVRDICHELGHRRGEANAVGVLGDVRSMTGDFPGAVRDLKAAQDLYDSIGDRRGRAYVTTTLGDVLGMLGDFPGAVRELEAALELQQDLGDRHGQANAMTGLGNVQRMAGDYADAARNLEAAVLTYQELGVGSNEATALSQYAALHAATGDHARALSLYQEALVSSRDTQQPDEEAVALEGLGECHLRAGDIETGTTHLAQALEIFERLGMTLYADRVRTRLSGVAS